MHTLCERSRGCCNKQSSSRVWASYCSRARTTTRPPAQAKERGLGVDSDVRSDTHLPSPPLFSPHIKGGILECSSFFLRSSILTCLAIPTIWILPLPDKHVPPALMSETEEAVMLPTFTKVMPSAQLRGTLVERIIFPSIR